MLDTRVGKRVVLVPRRHGARTRLLQEKAVAGKTNLRAEQRLGDPERGAADTERR